MFRNLGIMGFLAFLYFPKYIIGRVIYELIQFSSLLSVATEKHQMVYDENSGKVSLMIKSIGPGDEGKSIILSKKLIINQIMWISM